METHTHATFRWYGIARVRIDRDHLDRALSVNMLCAPERSEQEALPEPDEIFRKESIWIAEAIISDLDFDEFEFVAKTGSIMVAIQRQCTTCQELVGRLIAFTIEFSEVQPKDTPLQWLLLEHELIKALANTIFMKLKSRAPFPAASVKA